MTQDFSDPEATGKAELLQLQSLNTFGTISYVLHLIVAVACLIPGGQMSPVLLFAALILDIIKRPDAEGTWHASHYRWRIRSVVVAGVLYLVTAPLWLLLLLPGWLAWLVISVWFFYRIVTGMMAMNKGQEIGVKGANP